MAIPANIGPSRTYYDPSLWDRLVPAIRERQAELMQHLADGRWTKLEEAREMIGQLKAFEWLFKMAAELTKVEPEE